MKEGKNDSIEGKGEKTEKVPPRFRDLPTSTGGETDHLVAEGEREERLQTSLPLVQKKRAFLRSAERTLREKRYRNRRMLQVTSREGKEGQGPWSEEWIGGRVSLTSIHGRERLRYPFISAATGKKGEGARSDRAVRSIRQSGKKKGKRQPGVTRQGGSPFCPLPSRKGGAVLAAKRGEKYGEDR